jgi:hypothetical protein
MSFIPMFIGNYLIDLTGMLAQRKDLKIPVSAVRFRPRPPYSRLRSDAKPFFMAIAPKANDPAGQPPTHRTGMGARISQNKARPGRCWRNALPPDS